jgi:hypothetical protein
MLRQHCQLLAKAIPRALSHAVVVVLWIMLAHALFKAPPEVLNRL